MPILDTTDLPDDPIEQLLWLSGVQEQVNRELDLLWQSAYFEARFSGRLDAALALNLHSRKKVMAFTRAGNESRGRMIRWGDGRG